MAFTFQSDYMEGAHPLILQRLAETNLECRDTPRGVFKFNPSALKISKFKIRK